MNIFEYQNHFQYELKPRQGGALVVSDGSLPQTISTFVTIKLSHEFIQRLKRVISGPSLSFVFSWLVDDARRILEAESKYLLVSSVGSVSIMQGDGSYVADVRMRQVGHECEYVKMTMPLAVKQKVSESIIGKSTAAGFEKLAGYRLDLIQEEDKTCFLTRNPLLEAFYSEGLKKSGRKKGF